MNGGTANLDRNHGVQHPHGRLERLQVEVVVREQAEGPRVDTKAYARMDVLLRGLEPCVSLRLRRVEQAEASSYGRGHTCLKMW